jgi:hypothetical protein
MSFFGVTIVCGLIAVTVYGIIGTSLGAIGIAHPCNHEVSALITACRASDVFGMFVANITYFDHLGEQHDGLIESSVPCPPQQQLQLQQQQHVAVCYPDRHPGDFRNDTVFLKNPHAAPWLLSTGLVCLLPFIVAFLCAAPTRDTYSPLNVVVVSAATARQPVWSPV